MMKKNFAKYSPFDSATLNYEFSCRVNTLISDNLKVLNYLHRGRAFCIIHLRKGLIGMVLCSTSWMKMVEIRDYQEDLLLLESNGFVYGLNLFIYI